MMLFMLLQMLILVPSSGHSRGLWGNRLLDQRLLVACVRRHHLVGARGRITTIVDATCLDVHPVRSQYSDAGVRIKNRVRSGTSRRLKSPGTCRHAKRNVL